MKIGSKLMLSAAIAVVCSTIGSIIVTFVILREVQIHTTRDEMHSMIKQAETVRENFDRLHTAKAFDIPAMTTELASKPLRSTSLYQTIPVVAAWQSITPVAESMHFTFQTPSAPKIRARNPKNESTPAHKPLFDAFSQGSEEYFSTDNATITLARPVRISTSCLSCHGDPANSPTRNGLDLTGMPMENMQVGDLKGAFILSKTIDYSEANAAAMRVTAVGLGILAVVLIGFFLFTRTIVRPIQAMCATLGRVADGDLTVHADIRQQDEVGDMAGSLNGTVGGLRGMIGGISGNAQGIASSAEELSAISKQLSGNAETSASQAGQAAAAAAQVSASISTFASGIEEMGVTVSEIAKSAGQAAAVAQDGVGVAQEANTAMTRLGASSSEIGAIIKVITDIAEQTNLLALNATIEAARAGDAGRGFAVVASEVKDLARKTTQATDDIGKRVSGIQGDSEAAQDALRRISEIVRRINNLQQTIASAVEEQSATTKELASNVSQVAQAGSDIARNVNAVADAAKEASTGAGHTLQAATELATLAAALRQAVARFRT